jgi:class 3 adenylate cyclase/tetratricopeptide (TPR) repeat protein
VSKRQLSQSQLAPYVPRLLIEWQTEEPEKPFREIEGTLVFADISGFTRMSERLARKGKVGAEEVSEVLNHIFSRLLAVAREDGGDLLKFGGDALLLLFSGPEHASGASHAAVNMRRTLRECGRLRTSAGLVSLRMSMGIHTGKFHFFLAGDSRRELIITGPAASQTVAMESAADAGDILLSPATAAALDGGLLEAMKAGGYLLRKAPTISPGKPDLAAPGSGLDLEAFVPVAIQRRVAAKLNEGEHRLVTIGFVRFGGTDALLARVGPSEVLGELDGLVRAVQEAAVDYEICFLGTDIDRDGGKVILTAGAPDSRGNDEERMLRAVRAIADGRYGLELRMGVNRGYVFAGDLGAPFARAYAILGDATNLAARLMQRAEPGQILATESVLALSATEFKVKALEPFMVKGKARPIVAYSVGSIAGSRKRDIGRQLPLIGRKLEMETLLAGLQSARQERGGLIELVGEPGMGKSRLLEELEAHSEGVAYLATACEQYESSTPYFAFRGLLRSLVGVEREENTRRAGALVSERLQADAPELAPWLPLLAIPMDLSVPSTRECDELQPAFRKGRLHQVVAEFIQKLLRRTAALVFEDVHWMDEASSDLLSYLCEVVVSKPWLICVTRRPQDTGFVPSADLPRMTIALEPLGAQASAALASAAAEEMPLPQQQVAAVAERAGGNPLFVQELVAASTTQEVSDVLPDSIEAVITSRIDRLAPGDRTLLRYAAVIGPSFSLDLLDRVVGGEAEGVTRTTTWDRLAEFTGRESPGSFRFRHALFRDVAYEGLSYRRRRQLHERVGEELEHERAGSAEELAELLSLHFHRAQRYDRAWRYSVVAGERAQAKFANVEAADFYRRALEAARHVGSIGATELKRTCEALGDVCELAGLYADAAGAYRDALRFSRKTAASEARLIQKAGVVRERTGRYAQALRWYSRGLRCIGTCARTESDRASRVELGLAYAGVRFRQGRYSKCIRWCQGVLQDAEVCSDKACLAHTYYLLAHSYSFLGRPESKRYHALALAIYEELANLVGQANVLNNLGVEAYFEGKWDESLALYQRSKGARQRTGDIVGTATATNNIGEILSDQGRLPEAEELFLEASRAWRGAHYPIGVALATSNLGRAAARGGRLDDARKLLDEAFRHFRDIGAASFVLETEMRIAETCILGGDHSTALRLATDTLESASRMSGTTVLQAALQRLRGYAVLRAGDPDEAHQCFKESLRLGRSVGADYEVALSLEGMARLARLRGGRSPGSYLAEAKSILQRLGVVSTPRIPLPGD